MTDHDVMCPHTTHPFPDTCEGCLLIRRVRADEQERNGFGHVDELEHDLAHAESVAAKLVEVICDDAAVMAWDLKALEATARERDAARIDADYWKEQWQIAVQGIAKGAAGR